MKNRLPPNIPLGMSPSFTIRETADGATPSCSANRFGLNIVIWLVSILDEYPIGGSAPCALGYLGVGSV